jgi:hypothetical protein
MQQYRHRLDSQQRPLRLMKNSSSSNNNDFYTKLERIRSARALSSSSKLMIEHGNRANNIRHANETDMFISIHSSIYRYVMIIARNTVSMI